MCSFYFVLFIAFLCFLLTYVCWKFLCVAMYIIYLLLELISAQYLWCAPTTLYPFTVQGKGYQTVSTHHTYNSAMEFLIMNISYKHKVPQQYVSVICLVVPLSTYTDLIPLDPQIFNSFLFAFAHTKTS